MSQHELDIKRAVLLSARIRFSASGASLRDDAVERIIMQHMASSALTSLSAESIAEATRSISGPPLLSVADIRQGVERLIRRGSIAETASHGKKHYSLTSVASNETEKLLADAKSLIDDIVTMLFGTEKGGGVAYETAFLELLSRIFSRMSSEYISSITGVSKGLNHIAKLLTDAVTQTLQHHKVKDRPAFEHGVNRFFSEANPKFDLLKWRMAQNHFVVKALGVDSGARILSSDLLAGSTVYLDTNVIIAALMPHSRHPGGIAEVIKACKLLRITVKLMRITAEELTRAIAHHAATLCRVFDRIPDQTLSKVDCFLLEEYLFLKANDPTLLVDDFVSRFNNPIEMIRTTLGLEIDDDKWFDQEASSEVTVNLAKDVSSKFEAMRHRPKSDLAAIHDALMLRWVEKQHCDSSRACRFVTLDMTLVSKDKTTFYDNVITMDALLQWTTPHAHDDEANEHLASIYATSLRSQLLPTDLFFDTRDFLVFADMEVETRQLPADDVEACIRDIHKLGPTLDPSKPEDRERIGREIQRHFADPGTKFKSQLADLEAGNRDLCAKLDAEAKARQKAQAGLEATEQAVNVLSEKNTAIETALAEEHKAYLFALNRISQVETALSSLLEQGRRKTIIKGIIVRCFGMAICLFVALYFIGRWALQSGSGDNAFQKLTNAWAWLSLPVGIIAVLFPFVMGRERMGLLKWWKGDEGGQP